MTFDDDFTPLDQLECTIVDDLPDIRRRLNSFSGRTDIGWDQSATIDEIIDTLDCHISDLNEALGALKLDQAITKDI